MTVKCTFCNDTKQEPGIPGPCIWCEEIGPATTGAVERFTIATLRYAGGAEHDVRYVSEVHYDAALGREAALQQKIDSLEPLPGSLEKCLQAMADRDDALTREAALREELDRFKRLRCSFMKRVLCERDTAEQRLTVAEQRNAELVDVLRSVADYTRHPDYDWFPSDRDAVEAALKPAAEGEGS